MRNPRFVPWHSICGPSLDPPDDDRIDTCECGNDKDARDDVCQQCDREDALECKADELRELRLGLAPELED